MLPVEYDTLLKDIKEKIRTTRVRAALSVNHELVQLYLEIGHEILARQEREGWGRKVIDQLSKDLRTAFPDMRGLSRSNLHYMRAFAAAWPDEEFVQQAAGQIPWWHNVVLLEKLDDPETRLWYARKTIEHGWSRNVLVLQIESRLHERQGNAITNFSRTLPPIDLLLYHLRLRRYVVVELKVGDFKPEHVGKLNFCLEELPAP